MTPEELTVSRRAGSGGLKYLPSAASVLQRREPMQTSLRHTIVLVSVFLGALSFAAAREASVKRNVNLRSDPSTDNPAIELIQAKSTATLLDSTPQNGYYRRRRQGGMGLGQEHFLGCGNRRTVDTTSDFTQHANDAKRRETGTS